MRSPLVGPAYVARSKDLSNQRSVNLYLESTETPNGAAPNVLLGCPGLVSVLSLGAGPWRACAVNNGVMYAVVGSVCYSITPGLAATELGALSTASGRAYIEFNDAQVGFFHASGLSVLTLATQVFAEVALPYAGEVGVPASLDTLTLLTQPGTYVLWQSNPNDLTIWDPLNFTTEDGNAEPVVSIAPLHDTIVVLKTGSMCFYVNEGNPGFVFGRLPGVYPRVGCAVAATVSLLGEALLWVGVQDEGGPRVMMLEGYAARPVSTYAIDNTIQDYATISDGFGFSYTQESHPFYVLTFPAGGQTFVFDPKESAALRTQVWHERAGFAAGQFIPYAGFCTAQMGGQIYMGDAGSGRLYRLDLDNFQDNGGTRKILRSWRASAAPATYATEKCNYLDIAMETGVGVAPGANPQLVLRQSLDGGHGWSAEQYQAIGRMGETLSGVHFTRLGATRRGLNSDRSFEVSSTDVFFPAFLGAELG